MNKMTGILLMSLGAVLFTSGAFIYRKTPQIPEVLNTRGDVQMQMDQAIALAIADGVLTPREETKIAELARSLDLNSQQCIQQAQKQLDESQEESETEIIDHIKKKGDDFEKYVVQKFSPKYFNVKEWAGDKYVNGIYADTTLQPDLMMEFRLRNKKEVFSVECKWRNAFTNDKVHIAYKDQFQRYKNFSEQRQLPVFIALGIGGKASKPQDLYIIPLDDLYGHIVLESEIQKYKHDLKKGLFFDPKDKTLK